MALIVAGCGVPSEQSAVPINNGVPPGLVATTTTTTTTLPPTTTSTVSPPTSAAPTTATTPTSTVAPVPTDQLGLYYVQDANLVRVTREIQTTGAPIAPRAALSELERGPQPAEGPTLRSALPAGQIVDVQTSRGVAVVALAPTFRDIPDQMLAVAQIVLTITERGVGFVQFTIDGTPIQVPKADLSQTADPVVKEDYSMLLAAAGQGRVPDTSSTPVVTPSTSVGG